MEGTDTKAGKIVQVIGPVVDVEFESGLLPPIYNALRISGGAESEVDVIAEVEQHLGESRVRAVAMTATDGMQRGMLPSIRGLPYRFPSVPRHSGGCSTCLVTRLIFPTSQLTQRSGGRFTGQRHRL